MSPQADLEERVAKLEQLLARVLERARQHAAGRKILEYLGLS